MFPEHRHRRLRRTHGIRRMVQETRVSVDDLVYPVFVREGRGIEEPIESMPGQFRYSPDRLPALARRLASLRVPAVLLFGIPKDKDATGSGAFRKDGVVQQAVRRIKDAAGDLVVITDVCLCEYTDHGHCGILDDKGQVSNDETLEVLSQVALSHARSGADIVAPSDMMDGRVGVIREDLDENGYEHVAVMSYAVKYASCFYGPFREAACSRPAFGDRKTYQMDPANVREAMREAASDIEEGADIIMVKPAMPYLDVVRCVADEFDVPLASYQVSGEYAMIKAASERGWLDEDACILESVGAIKRAGADLIVTYFAPRLAELLA